MGDTKHWPVHAISWADQFFVRSGHVRCSVLDIRSKRRHQTPRIPNRLVCRGAPVTDIDCLLAEDAEDSVCSKLAGWSAAGQHRDRDDGGGGIAVLVHRFLNWIRAPAAGLFLLVGRNLVGLLLGRPRYQELVFGSV